MSKDWSDAELKVCVDAYLNMAKQTAQQAVFIKKSVYADLSARTGRSVKSVELRMQNISAVVVGLDRQFLKGLMPASNVGTNVYGRLAGLLQSHSDFSSLQPLTHLSYKNKLPAIREWLIRCAQARKPVFYSDVMLAFDIDRYSLRHGMDMLGHGSKNNGEPILTALLVSKKENRCSAGFAAEFGIQDDALEREKLYAYWADRPAVEVAMGLPVAPSLSERAVRFACVEIRPDQAAFRRKVYERYRGVCVVSGCGVDKALDAAHREGRAWRKGHNNAEDGLLLRKDLHALYDNGLLSISNAGVVSLSPHASKDYAAFDGVTVSEW